jgi:cell division transport system permease protein
MQGLVSRAWYFFGETLRGLVRQKSLTLATLVSTSSTLFVFGTILLMTANVQLVSNQLEQRKGILAFLEDGLTGGQIEYLRAEIQKLPELEELKFVSKEEALEQFRRSLADDDLLEALGSNPLPASFEIKLKAGQRGAEELERVSNTIGGLRGVEEVSYGGAWTMRLDKLLDSLTLVNIVVGAIVGLAVGFVIANVVRLTLLARKESIRIMKIVGATKHFVRIPFLLEGFLLTLTSALISLALLYALQGFLADRLPDVVFLSPSLTGLFILVGVGSGMVGSLLTLHEVLREEMARATSGR